MAKRPPKIEARLRKKEMAARAMRAAQEPPPTIYFGGQALKPPTKKGSKR
jgi:hypothetical protein